MGSVSLPAKLYFAAVGALAIWVGYWGAFAPAEVATAIPWTVPPLHARFLGSMYLSGAAMMAGCIFARRWCEVRVIVPMIAIWTALLFLVSLLYASEFDPALTQTWVWFAAYLAYPMIAAALAWTHRGRGDADPHGAHGLGRFFGPYMWAQGAVLAVLGLALLVGAHQMVRVWPWKITPLLANLYAAPFLSFAVGSFLLVQERSWAHVRIGVAGMLVFAAGVLLASTVHRALFSAADMADALWFLTFGAAVVCLSGFIISRSRPTA